MPELEKIHPLVAARVLQLMGVTVYGLESPSDHHRKIIVGHSH
jgi:hypothetical protein